jgi:Reverse transcriptase (RNA-dependent DNA polymerase)
LSNLHSRVHRGAYRALPSRRKYIKKSDGRQRPLGIAALEDKIVQAATVTILNQIYEEDFLGFSYGFRPGRSQHDALDALAVAIEHKKVSYILDCDIRSFFDTLDKSWLLQFVEHRVADRRILRLIQKWLKAGVLEDGMWSDPEAGTPQGSVPGHFCSRRLEGEMIGMDDVVHEGEIAALLAVPKNCRRFSREHLGDELGQHPRIRGAGILPRSEDIEVAQGNRFQSITAPERAHVMLAGKLGHRIGRDWAGKHVFSLG